MNYKKENKKLKKALIRECKIRTEREKRLRGLEAHIFHDFNKFLTHISGPASYLKIILEEGRITDKGIKHIDNIIQKVNGFCLPNQSFYKAKNGTPSELQPVDLNKSLEESLDSIDYNGINLVKKFDENLSPIMADPKQLFKVCLNLVSNAKTAMPNGGNLTIITKNVGDNVKIYFRDTGIGIPKDEIKKIFDHGFTTTENGQGSGLDIVKTIVEEHKGEVYAMSKLGKGTTFRIRLPKYQKGE